MYLDTGSVSKSFPSSSNNMIPTLVMAFVWQAMRKRASFSHRFWGVGIVQTIRLMPEYLSILQDQQYCAGNLLFLDKLGH